MSSKKQEKQLRLATSFLANAPEGEFDLVASDLDAVTGNPKLVASARDAAYLQWAHAQAHLVPLDGNNVIVCDEAKVSEGTYVNPYTQTLFKYDSASKSFKSTKDKAHTSTPQRAQLQQLLTEYARATYKSTIGVGVYDTKGGVLIVLRSASLSLKNYRTGNVIARYKLESNGKLSGSITATQHYFETGNVMCHNGSKLETSVGGGDLQGAVAKIREFENQWVRNYLAAFDWLFNEGMAKLRRKLPVSGTKINWEAEFRGLAGMATPQ
jgi:capping protein alpha